MRSSSTGLLLLTLICCVYPIAFHFVVFEWLLKLRARPMDWDAVREALATHRSREDRLLNQALFERFAMRAYEARDRLRTLVTDVKSRGQSVYSYGATAKGNTLLNFVGLTRDHITYCVDNTPTKQGRYLPKSNVRIISEEAALAEPPDYFLLTAWNYKDEIIAKVRKSGNNRSKFIVPIPLVHVA